EPAGACLTGTPRIKCGPHHPTAAASEQANTRPTYKEQEMRGSTPEQRASQRARFARMGFVRAGLVPAGFVKASLAILTVLALAGCSGFGGRGNSYTCPATSTVPELQTLVQVVPGPNGATIQSSGRINSVSGE